MRRVKGKALGQARLAGTQDAADAVVTVAGGPVSDVLDALQVARCVVGVAPPQDGAALGGSGGLWIDLIAQRRPGAGEGLNNMTIFLKNRLVVTRSLQSMSSD